MVTLYKVLTKFGKYLIQNCCVTTQYIYTTVQMNFSQISSIYHYNNYLQYQPCSVVTKWLSYERSNEISNFFLTSSTHFSPNF